LNLSLDATYSLDENLSGVGVYSREILFGLAAAHPEARFRFCYRPHRLWRAFAESLPDNVRRWPLQEPLSPGGDLFHGLNQRLPRVRLRRAVATFHDLFVLTGDYSTAEFRRRFAAQARDAAARADAIITVSQFTAAQVEELLGVERARIHPIAHGVRRLKYPPAERENVVLHVGAIQTRKNIARLVAAFEQLPQDWRLVLAGSLGHGAAEILNGMERSPARRRTLITGYVSSEELAKWYARARIFAFPSLDEGFGMPALEAMAAGIPVVASRRAGLPEVCGDAAILVDPENQEELTSALLLLAGSDVTREKLVRRGYARASGFTWTRAVQMTWQVYSSLL
jgi:glycosyltransferase involved in cell wall biosynthesis